MVHPATAILPNDWRLRRPVREAMSDLLSRIATDRSDEAFRSLFEEYSPRIRNFMLQQGADPSLAEELAQETLLTVWRKAALYSADKGSATTWIYTIARNLRTDHIRQRRVWQEVPEEEASFVPADDAPADAIVDERQRHARVRDVLRQLPAEQVEVVRLAFMEGLAHGEIAERLSLPLGTVKSRIRLAYQKLRASLEDLK